MSKMRFNDWVEILGAQLRNQGDPRAQESEAAKGGRDSANPALRPALLPATGNLPAAQRLPTSVADRLPALAPGKRGLFLQPVAGSSCPDLARKQSNRRQIKGKY